MSLAMQALTTVEDDAEDPQLVAAITDGGGGDILQILDRVAEMSVADRLLAEQASARADRLEARADKARDLIRRIMEALELQKLERPTYTVTMAEGPKSVVVQD